jgi:pyruvate/2-oxoglutarate dehydrogenase complex dihydrolipoamide acyltransferase (E2) component
MITVRGIATKPRYLNGQLKPQELLDLTISVDHDIVDGAPAARFARRLAEFVDAAEGFDTVSGAAHESKTLGAG